MKKIFSYILTIASASVLVLSCDYLDKREETSSLSEEDVFGNAEYFEEFVEWLVQNPVMRHLQAAQAPFGTWDDIADGSMGTMSFSIPYQYAKAGDYLTMITMDRAKQCNMNCWKKYWKHIRIANQGIVHIDMFPGAPEDRDRLLGLCYFYRGFSYFELCRRWGGLPYFEKPLSLSEDLDFERPDMRSTYLAAAEDFDKAAALLEPVIPKTMWQHPTSVAALAFKAKCLLYAASPQATLEGGKTREPLWEEAAVAADAAIKAAEDNGYYLVPGENLYDIYNDKQEDIQIAEVLWGRRHAINWNSDAYIHTLRPPGTLGGKYGPAINQSLVNAFDMENGYPITDPKSNYNPQDPYKGRGARFEQCIMHNQSEPYPGKVLNIYNYTQNADGSRSLTGSPDMTYTNGKLAEGFTTTGTYIKKWMGNTWQEGSHKMVWPEIRIAELYIMLAEAATEAGWDWKTNHGDFRYSAIDALNKVRNRAGIANLPPEYSDTKEHFMERVQNERRVELCFEDQRFWDIRRLLIGTKIDQSMYRVMITKLAPGYDASVYPTGFMYEYEDEPFDTHIYVDRMNLFPISLDDVNMGTKFKQNPGW